MPFNYRLVPHLHPTLVYYPAYLIESIADSGAGKFAAYFEQTDETHCLKPVQFQRCWRF
jgi:hypothetical protein